MKKATVRTISSFLNRTLRVKTIKDTSVNGLQVNSRKTGAVRTVGFAVDACITTFRKAKEQGVDLLVVHHGIKWRPQRDRALVLRRETFLKRHGIALYAAHLPLDLHREYGNNVQLARALELQDLKKFGRYHGIKIGYSGKVPSAASPGKIAERIGKALQSPIRVFPFGKERVRSIGIVSGGGGSMLVDAVEEGLDCFLVGEVDLAAYNAAKDHGMNLIAAGHYATETVGVKALMPLIEGVFAVRTVFIADVKNL